MNQRDFTGISGGGRIFDHMISLDNLFISWCEFKKGKRSRKDIQKFEFSLEDNIFQLYKELLDNKYQHSNYTPFYITDPKLRHIFKASVKDRLLHHAVFRILYPIFDPTFIFDSYSCRIEKGTHSAVDRLEKFIRKESRNYKHTVYVLKCDIRRFFDSVDHVALFNLISKKIKDKKALSLVYSILSSYEKDIGKGIPLGNVTSQLFANIYLNELDVYIKHILKIKYYLRYCDDFLIISKDKIYLEKLIPVVEEFLLNKLLLNLHPNKVEIVKFSQGIDFLGYISIPYYRKLRTKTKNRMIRNLNIIQNKSNEGLLDEVKFNQSIQSYLGILKHCNSYKLKQKINKTIAVF